MSNGLRRDMWHLWELKRNVIWVPLPERKMKKNTGGEKAQPGKPSGWDADDPT